MKNYLKLMILITVINAVEVKSADIADRIADAFSRKNKTVTIHNDAMSYDFYVGANNEKSKDDMHFVGRSKDDQDIEIPLRIRKHNNRDEAQLTIIYSEVDGNKIRDRKRTFNISAPVGNLMQLDTINVNYSKGYFGNKKGFSLNFMPNNLGIIAQ